MELTNFFLCVQYALSSLW